MAKNKSTKRKATRKTKKKTKISATQEVTIKAMLPPAESWLPVLDTDKLKEDKEIADAVRERVKELDQMKQLDVEQVPKKPWYKRMFGF